MVAISFIRNAGSPTSPPVYDPREGIGISFYADTTNNVIWVGLAKSGSVTWGSFSAASTATGSGTNVYTVNPPVVTTSNLAPDSPPQYIPSEGRIHFHISYFTDNTYSMYVGISISPGLWERYDISSTI